MMKQKIIFILCLHSLFGFSQEQFVEKLDKMVGGPKIGQILSSISHNGSTYIYAQDQNRGVAPTWYIYNYNVAPTTTTFASLPFEVQVQSKDGFDKGAFYNGKYYYPHNERIYIYDQANQTDQLLNVTYPDGFKRLSSKFMTFNNKLYFSAKTDDHGIELMSYDLTNDIQLAADIFPGERISTSGSILKNSSRPRILTIWNNHLLFWANDGDNLTTGTYGGEIFKLDTQGNATVLNDFIQGSGGSSYNVYDFFGKKTLVYVKARKKFYELQNDGSYTETTIAGLQKYPTFDVLKAQMMGDYFVINATLEFNNGFASRTHLLIVKQDESVFQTDLEPSRFDLGVLFKDHYLIYSGNNNYFIGNEPFIVDLSNNKTSLLKDIRTAPYNGIFGLVFGSEPIRLVATENEVLFSAETTDIINSFDVFSVRFNENTTNNYQLNTKSIGDGNVTPGSGLINKSTNVTLQATPTSGFRFAGWQGDVLGKGNPINLTMNGDKNVSALFLQDNDTRLLRIRREGLGKVERSVDKLLYDLNEKVTITAIPEKGFVFKEWKGDINSTNEKIEITLDDDKYVTAVFEYKILNTTDLSIEDNGAILYPNPSNNFVTIITKESVKELCLYSINGKKLESHYNTKTINVSHLTNGVYFVKIKTASNKLEVLKLVKK